MRSFDLFGRKQQQAFIDMLNYKSDKSLRHTKANQKKVDDLTTYLNDRRVKNSFGKDFEVSLRKKKVDDD